MNESDAAPGTDGAAVAGRDYSRPLVWALSPYRIDDGRLLADDWDLEPTKSQLALSFARLGLPWIWQPVVLGSVDEVVAQVAASHAERPTVVFNLCDGFESDGYPGVSVVKALEAAGLPFTGADSRFYAISSSKLDMKIRFKGSGVETPAWEELPPAGPVTGLCERLGTPLLLKPDVSYASVGISLRSKVDSDGAAEARRDEIRQTEMNEADGCLPEGPIFAERFMGGHEYTVFVGGYWDQPETIWNLLCSIT